MERRLADLAAPDVNLGAVAEQRLHHRRLPGLNRQVERGVVVLREEKEILIQQNPFITLQLVRKENYLVSQLTSYVVSNELP